MHYKCFQDWEHGEEFVTKYNERMGTKDHWMEQDGHIKVVDRCWCDNVFFISVVAVFLFTIGCMTYWLFIS